MRANPINLLLTGIAVADMLVMMDYVPFAVHMYLLEDRNLEEEVGRYIQNQKFSPFRFSILLFSITLMIYQTFLEKDFEIIF